MSRWVWAGARAVGTSHLAQAQPCQDAFACKVWQRPGAEPVLVAVLADGAGSAARADVGASLATALVRDIVCEALDDGIDFDDVPELLRHALRETRLALELKATYDGREINDYASTLLAVVAHPSGTVAGQIGDGAIVVDTGAGGWRVVHWPDHGEYASNENVNLSCCRFHGLYPRPADLAGLRSARHAFRCGTNQHRGTRLAGNWVRVA